MENFSSVKYCIGPMSKNVVDSIAEKLNWGADKLRDDITCLALDLKNTELINPKKIQKQDIKS